MARLTAADMVDIVRDCLGGETSETISDTRILRYLNQSYLQLCSEFNFQQLSTSTTITTTSGTAAYELSVDTVLSFTDIIDDTNNLKLRSCSEEQYNSWTQGSAVSGTPDKWFLSGVGSNNRYEITFFPTPAGTYTMNVYFNQKPTELIASPSASATSTIIPEAWDDSIIRRAVSRGWLMLGDIPAAKEWTKAARENDFSASKSTYVPSETPIYPRSIVGRALMDVS